MTHRPNYQPADECQRLCCGINRPHPLVVCGADRCGNSKSELADFDCTEPTPRQLSVGWTTEQLRALVEFVESMKPATFPGVDQALTYEVVLRDGVGSAAVSVSVDPKMPAPVIRFEADR